MIKRNFFLSLSALLLIFTMIGCSNNDVGNDAENNNEKEEFFIKTVD